MCTMISSRNPLSGQAKGSHGWFAIEQLYLAYDHPERVQLEHAVLLDFTNESEGLRLAVELSPGAATDLAERILRTVAAGERYESGL